jgi:hypothetical protein
VFSIEVLTAPEADLLWGLSAGQYGQPVAVVPSSARRR